MHFTLISGHLIILFLKYKTEEIIPNGSLILVDLGSCSQIISVLVLLHLLFFKCHWWFPFSNVNLQIKCTHQRLISLVGSFLIWFYNYFTQYHLSALFSGVSILINHLIIGSCLYCLLASWISRWMRRGTFVVWWQMMNSWPNQLTLSWFYFSC